MLINSLTNVSTLRRGDLVEAVHIPEGITLPRPQLGERGVCFEESDAYGDGNGPMVRFANGGVCNVYGGWVALCSVIDGKVVT